MCPVSNQPPVKHDQVKNFRENAKLKKSVTRLLIGTFLVFMLVIYILDSTGQRGGEVGGSTNIMGRRYQDRRRRFTRIV